MYRRMANAARASGTKPAVPGIVLGRIRQAQAGDVAARDKVFLDFYWLVRRATRKWQSRWTDGNRDSTRCCNSAIGGRSLFGSKIRSNERHDCRHDQRRPDAFKQRPSKNKDRKFRSDRCNKRSNAINNKTDRERSATTN